jgi:predicted alpha/beta superfamily hydrolase
MPVTTDTWLDYAVARAGLPHTVVGKVKVLERVWSPQLGNRRDLFVYLPPSYPDGRREWPILYAQDGQNLFDEFASFAGEWRMDETLEALAAEGLEAVVVGVANTPERMLEYSPFLDRLGGGRGDLYLRFLLEIVKPLVEAEFRVARRREWTGILGSSMGGHLALYALFAAPWAFGLVGALSPSVLFARGALLDYVARKSWVPARIYLDVGTREGRTWPARGGVLAMLRRWPYPTRVRELRRTLERLGYRPGVDLEYLEEVGGQHQESAWARRLPGALRFLLAGTTA